MLVFVRVPSVAQIDLFEIMFKKVLNFIYTLTLKMLILQLRMKGLPV